MSTIGAITLQRVRFPGRAGELQARAATASLVRELGDGYERYHAFLVAELERVGGRPDRADFDDGDAYIEAFETAREIVVAEALLRNCRAFRREGRALDAALDPSTPLLDKDDRLVRMPM